MSTVKEPGFYIVGRDAAPEYLRVAGDMVEAALDADPGKYRPEDIANLVLSGDQVMWLALRDGLEGVMLTRLIQYPTGQIGALVFGAAGKDSRYWSGEPFQRIEDWARAGGATFMEFYGRRGWEKKMGPEWRRRAFMRKEL